MQHAGRILMAALHAKGVRVNQQLRPAAQSLLSESHQGQAAQRRQLRARRCVQGEVGEWGDGLVVQEARHQRLQDGVPGRIQSVQ
jgi:hypothetical protein